MLRACSAFNSRGQRLPDEMAQHARTPARLRVDVPLQHEHAWRASRLLVSNAVKSRVLEPIEPDHSAGHCVQPASANQHMTAPLAASHHPGRSPKYAAVTSPSAVRHDRRPRMVKDATGYCLAALKLFHRCAATVG